MDFYVVTSVRPSEEFVGTWFFTNLPDAKAKYAAVVAYVNENEPSFGDAVTMKGPFSPGDNTEELGYEIAQFCVCGAKP